MSSTRDSHCTLLSSPDFHCLTKADCFFRFCVLNKKHKNETHKKVSTFSIQSFSECLLFCLTGELAQEHSFSSLAGYFTCTACIQPVGENVVWFMPAERRLATKTTS
jgi:hypothetical protein